MKKSAYLLIDYGKGEIKKFFLDKEKTIVGSDSECDIVLDYPSVPARFIEITVTGDFCVFRSLTEKGLIVSGENVFEKILEKEDSFSMNDLRVEFCPPEETTESAGMAVTEKFFKKMIVYALLTIIFIYICGNLFLTVQEKIVLRRTEALRPRKAEEVVAAEVEVISEQDLIGLIAEVRRKDMIARYLMTQTNIDLTNYSFAVQEWIVALEKLKNVECPPKVKEKIVKEAGYAKAEAKEIAGFMRKNAYIAYQQGRDEDLIRLLDNIMKIIDDQTDSDYMWAKKKYLGMLGSNKKGDKK